MTNWECNYDGGYEIQFEDEYAAVARFLNGSTRGYVNSITVAEFDEQFKKDNNYTYTTRIKDWLVFFETLSRLLLPLLAFLAGQAILYSFYFIQGRVFLVDFVFDEIEVFQLVISSVIGAISFVCVIFGSRILFHKLEMVDAWFYIIVSSLIFAGLPMLAGAVLLIPSIAIIPLVKSYNGKYIPVVIAIDAFVIGQIVLWTTYLLKGYVAGLTELLLRLEVENFDTLYVLIISSITGTVATIVSTGLGYEFTHYYKKRAAYGITIVFCLLTSMVPALLNALAFVIVFIVACYKHDKINFQVLSASYIVFAMASMLLMFISEVPLWVLLIMAAIEFGVFCALFHGRSSLSNFGKEFNIFSIIVVAILGIAFMGYAIYRMDSILPNLATLKEMVARNQASSDYLSAVTKDAQVAMIIGSVVATIVMIILICNGKRFIPSITLPLMTISGMMSFYLILSELVKLPESSGDEYTSMFILWVILGSILIALPTVVFQIISYFIGKKASRSYY